MTPPCLSQEVAKPHLGPLFHQQALRDSTKVESISISTSVATLWDPFLRASGSVERYLRFFVRTENVDLWLGHCSSFVWLVCMHQANLCRSFARCIPRVSAVFRRSCDLSLHVGQSPGASRLVMIPLVRSKYSWVSLGCWYLIPDPLATRRD